MKGNILIPLLLMATMLTAETKDNTSSPITQMYAIRSTEPIVVDGILSESIWNNGYGISNFRQRDPNEGALPSQKTIVHVVYDDKCLYVGARLYDSAPDSIIARLGRRDTWLSADQFIFFIDPYYDRRSGFYFGVNAAGTLYDGTLFNDDWDDDSWDGIWTGRVNIDNEGWTAEIRIPYSQLRFHKKDKYVWAVNFKRVIERKNESDYLVYTPKNGSGFVSRFIDLVGIENIVPSRNAEVLPYVRTKAEYTNPEPGDPFNDGSRQLPGLGADLKFGIGNNLTLDVTVNPDFGQVEVDPAVVNLSDVETFYREKRPFFIEGSTIFNFGRGGASNYWNFNWADPDFFYSRRIGRSPQGELPDYDFATMPEGTRILGAAKLSGKVAGNWNIGTIHAITNREYAEIEFEGQRSRREIEPLTYYGIFRGQKEFKQGRQGLGMISTLTARRFHEDRLRDEINSAAYTLGIDGWSFLDADKAWVITGWTGMTHVRANETRMIELQRNSQHYFQRPDASHVSVDSSATSMTGYAARLWLNKQKGNVIFNSALGFIDPKFDVNDVGFMWRGDVINGHIGFGYQWVKPAKFTRHAELIFATFRSYDFDKNLIWSGYFHMGFLRFLNYYRLRYMLAYNPQTINNRRTRGGSLTLNLPGWEANFFASTDNRKTWVFEIGTFGYTGQSGSLFRGVEFEVEWKPSANISISFEPEFTYDHENAQWVDYFEDPLATETFGNRYVFAKLDQKTLASSIRLNWTFTPQLSLQLYAQPLISSGDYYDFKELARPKSYDFNLYGENGSTITFKDGEYIADPDGDGPAAPITWSNPDFNFKSLRGNAVLRWEYMPGSVLYLVWTQRKSDYEEIGDFRFKRSLNRLVDTKADNIFMVKLTYWCNL